jgi:single-strand DNA-binding protein
VYLEGKLKTRKWQGEDGQQKYTTEVHINEFNFLNNRTEMSNDKLDNPAMEAPKLTDNASQTDDLPF